jgi:hypothetical protein
MTTDPNRPLLPADLTYQQRKALDLVAGNSRLYRVTRGWGIKPNHLTLVIAAQLVGLGLARVDRTGSPRLVLTGAGQNLHAVIEARRERKAA